VGQPATKMRKRKPTVANISHPTRHNEVRRRTGYKGNGNWVANQAESHMFPALNHYACVIPIDRKERWESLVCVAYTRKTLISQDITTCI
jgi:hypothetical protein